MQELVRYWRGESVNLDNVSGETFGTFGRFAAVLSTDRARAVQTDDGEWVAMMPNGSSYQSDLRDEDEAFRASCDIFQRQGWTTDRDVAIAQAVHLAKERHNSHCEMKPSTYGAKYGGPVD